MPIPSGSCCDPGDHRRRHGRELTVEVLDDTGFQIGAGLYSGFERGLAAAASFW